MMQSLYRSDSGTATRSPVLILALVAAIVQLAGCDLLDVQAPSRLPAADIETPENVSVLRDGAIADFDCALGNYALAAALMGDEFDDVQQQAALWGYDRRDFTPAGGTYASQPCDPSSTGLGLYIPIQTARGAADNLLSNLDTWSDSDVPNRTAEIAMAAAYSGYAHILLGEGFCSAAIDLGPELTRTEVFERAEQKLTRALDAAQSAGLDDIENMARVGRARALVNLGRSAEAAGDAALVPAGFLRVANFSSADPRTENKTFVLNIRTGRVSVGPLYRNLEFAGVPDPRVPVIDAGVVADNKTHQLYTQSLYTSESTPIPLATWEEAQLIIAEAALEAGDVQGAVDIITLLHSQLGLPPFDSQDADQVRDQLIEERRRELFLQGHHLQDIIRFGLPLVPAPGTPYTNGLGGGLWGSNTCLPLPDVERLNNPNID